MYNLHHLPLCYLRCFSIKKGGELKWEGWKRAETERTEATGIKENDLPLMVGQSTTHGRYQIEKKKQTEAYHGG